MVRLTKLLATLVTSASFMIAAASHADIKPTGKAKDFLFVIEAKAATLKHVNSDVYTLTIERKSIQSVLAFSDRPARLAMQMTPEDYAKLVHSARSDSFDRNPPNIALIWAGDGPAAAAYEIMRYTRDSNAIVYTIKKLHTKDDAGPVSYRHGAVALFIDGGSLAPRIGNSS